MSTIIWAVYFIGLIPAFRSIAGAAVHEFSSVSYDGEIEPFDIFMGCFVAIILMWTWPVMFLGRQVYKVIKRHAGSNALAVMFPPLKPIESKTEEATRLRREQKAQMRKRQEEINAAEREAGLVPTRW